MSPEISFPCQHCAQHLEAPEDMAGETLSCPACNGQITVPHIPQATAPDPSPTQQPQSAPKSLAPSVGVTAQTCPSCGGDLQIPEGRSTIHCMFCGQQLHIDRDQTPPSESQKEQAQLRKYLQLAQTAEASGNALEAYNYYSKILEIDPENVEAWVGKGISAGWQSTLAAPRLQETAVCIEKALELGVNENKDLRDKAVEGTHNVATGFYNTALNHFNEFQQSTTQYSTGFLDMLEYSAQDKAHNTQLLAEFVGYADASVGLLLMCERMQVTEGVASDIVVMCSTLAGIKGLDQNVRNAYQQLVNKWDAWLNQRSATYRKAKSDATSGEATKMVWTLIGSIAFVLLGIWIMSEGEGGGIVGILCIGFFGFCAVVALVKLIGLSAK